MGISDLRAAKLAALGVALLALAACNNEEPADAPVAETEASAAPASPSAAPPAAAAAAADNAEAWLYNCRAADTPAPAANCTTERSAEGVTHTCPTEANPPPQGCTVVHRPPRVQGPACPGTGCPDTPMRE